MTSAQSSETHPASPVDSKGLTAFDSAQLRVERLKAWLTAGSIVATVGAAIVTYASTQAAQRRQAVDAFQLKAAEIAMASRTPLGGQGEDERARRALPENAI